MMALLLTTLAITIVASLFWQQQVQVRSIENQRLQLQKQWILRGALDWASLILRENARTNSNYDALDDPWAVPLEETRLDQYVEGGDNADASDASISGSIVDAQSRFNIANLLTPNGGIDSVQQDIFKKLLTNLQLEPSLAEKLTSVMDSTAQAASGISTAQFMPISYVDDLRAVPGFTPAVMEKLKDYVVVLPQRTDTINVETASAELIAATLDTLSLSDAKALVALRTRIGHFMSIQTFPTEANLSGKLSSGDMTRIATTTDFFLVNGNVRLSHAGLYMQALVYRPRAPQGAAPPIMGPVWIRQR